MVVADLLCSQQPSTIKLQQLELNPAGFVQPLHGDMSQQAREAVLQRFRDGRVMCLIATDVAARGLDIANVDLVVHYELPRDHESFLHRQAPGGHTAGVCNLLLHLVIRSELSEGCSLCAVPSVSRLCVAATAA